MCSTLSRAKLVSIKIRLFLLNLEQSQSDLSVGHLQISSIELKSRIHAFKSLEEPSVLNKYFCPKVL